MNKKKYLIIIAQVLSLCLALLIVTILLNFNNLLKFKPDFISSKTLFKKPIFCANAFVDTRPALAANRLNLAAWHGFQEVIYSKSVSFAKINYDFYLSDNASLIFIFNKDEKNYTGVWLSADDDYPSCYFEANNDGKYLKVFRLSILNLKRNSWNKFTLVNGNNPYLLINGKKIEDIFFVIADNKHIGFRSYNSYGSQTAVDNLRILLKNDQLIKENFSNTKNMLLFFVVSSLILLIFDFLIFNMRFNSMLFYLYIKILMVILLLFYMFIDLFYIAMRYDHFFISKHKVLDSVKSVEYICNELNSYNLDQDQYRIILLGTSQTWGEGAAREDQTISNQLEKLLQHRFPNLRIKCINCSIPGSSSGQLAELYVRENWAKFQPKIMIINLGNNDKDPDILYESVEKLILDNEKNNIVTILSKEANYFQLKGSPSEQVISLNRQVLDTLARKYDLVLIDLNQYINNNNNKNGLLWWDAVHLSAYGQELAARLYYNIVFNSISNKK